MTAVEARDDAIARVTGSNKSFIETALQAVESLPTGEYTGEDIRLRLAGVGIQPLHHNAWGAVILKALQGGLLTPTGAFRAMTAPQSHARITRVYRRGGVI